MRDSSSVETTRGTGHPHDERADAVRQPLRVRPTAAGTLVTLHADVQIRGAASLGPLAAKAVKRGVDADFATLRDILERDDS